MRKRGIDLTGFRVEYRGDYRSGTVLMRLMGCFDEKELNLNTAAYYATRGKLTNLDEFVELKYNRNLSALSIACKGGRFEAHNEGRTSLMYAATSGRVGVVRLFLFF